ASVTAKAMDGVKSLELQRLGAPRGQWSGTVGGWTQEPGKPSPAHGLRSRGALGRITGEPREVVRSREGGGGGRSTARARRTTQPWAMGRAPASSTLARRDGLVNARRGSRRATPRPRPSAPAL